MANVVIHKFQFINGRKINADYIRGLAEGEGCFTFCKTKSGYLPTFSIGMHIRDQHLLIKVADYWGIDNEVYTYEAYKAKDGFKRGATARLLVRDLPSLKGVIIPFFYKKLIGNKSIQFEEWIERIGNDPQVPMRFKVIHELYHSGFWDKPENHLIVWQ
jgi:hypothetical protein